jgi:hypothetical protein
VSQDETLTWDLDLAIQLTRPIGSSEHRAPMIQAVAQALREAYERGATEMRSAAVEIFVAPSDLESHAFVVNGERIKTENGAARFLVTAEVSKMLNDRVEKVRALPASRETTK